MNRILSMLLIIILEVSLIGCNQENSTKQVYDVNELYIHKSVTTNESSIESFEKQNNNSMQIDEKKSEQENTDDLEYTIDDLILDIKESYDPEIANNKDVHDYTNKEPSTIDYIYYPEEEYVYLLNNKYFDLIYGEKRYSSEELFDIINNNSNISQQYKTFICEFTRCMLDFFPDADTRIYADNLKHLRIIKNVSQEIMGSNVAAYDRSTKAIVIKNNLDLESSIKDRLVFRHELGHMFVNIQTKKKGLTFAYSFKYLTHGYALEEALDVIYTTAPFIEEYAKFSMESLGYPLTTNIVRVILDYIGDYSFQDMMIGNIYTFEALVNRCVGKAGALVEDEYGFNYIEDIIELQKVDYYSEDEELETIYYEDLYRYITDLYILTNDIDLENMDQEEFRQELMDMYTKGAKKVDYMDDAIDNVVSKVLTHGH